MRDAEESRHGPEKKRKRQGEANKHVKELGTKESLVRRDVISEVNMGSVTAYAHPLKKRTRTLKTEDPVHAEQSGGGFGPETYKLNRIQSHQGGMKASDGHGAEVPFPADIRHAHAAGAANVNDSSHAAQSLTASSTSKLYSHSSHVFLH